MVRMQISQVGLSINILNPDPYKFGSPVFWCSNDEIDMVLQMKPDL